MNQIYESEQIAKRARKRITDLVGREMSTDDPLMAEIALAQVDATLAQAQATMELRDVLSRIDRVEMRSGHQEVTHHHIYTLHERIDDLYKSMDVLAATINAMVRGGANDVISKEPWWAFWRQHGK